MKTSELVARIEEELRRTHGDLERVYGYLNSFARQEHMGDNAVVDPMALLAQVYGDLAPAKNRLNALLEEL